MGKILFFNYCAIPIFIIILLTTFLRKTTKGSTNRLFVLLILLSLFTDILDIVADGYERFLPLKDKTLAVVTAANYLYFLFRNSLAVVYLAFLMALTRTGFHFKTLGSRFALLIPYLTVLGVLFTNPIHQMAFTVTSEAGYSRGPLIIVFYISSILYSIMGAAYLVYCYKFFRFGKWLALMSMYFLSFIGIFIQFFLPNVLIEIYSTSIAFLLVILMVLRPEEITDTNVGLPSWKAYQEELFKIEKVHRPVQIVVVRLINAPQVRDYLGEEKFNRCIRQAALVIETRCKKDKVPLDLYYEAPGIFYLVFDKTAVKHIHVESRFESIVGEVRAVTHEVEREGIYMRPRFCTINYPKDVDSKQEIIQLGHSFHEMLSEGQHYINASQLVGTRRYEIEANMSSILNRAILGPSFEMHYQPIFDVKQNRFRSAEALIRLNDEFYGSISPELFIPDAEKNGLINTVGDFVLEAVFRFISRQNIKDYGLDYIEINLSVAQCFQVDIADKIIRLQEKYKVHPCCVNFEITETTYSDIGSLAKRNIQRLVEEGYTFSLDDYGTGYSNIQRLVKLPLSLIKLDKSMIAELNTQDGCSLVRNTVKMMKDIRKSVLAEGVETKEQLDILTEMDCDYIQGFYFSKPLPSDDFLKFIQQSNNL